MKPYRLPLVIVFACVLAFPLRAQQGLPGSPESRSSALFQTAPAPDVLSLEVAVTVSQPLELGQRAARRRVVAERTVTRAEVRGNHLKAVFDDHLGLFVLEQVIGTEIRP